MRAELSLPNEMVMSQSCVARLAAAAVLGVVLLAGCAAVPPSPMTTTAMREDRPPPGFAAALERALPFVVGVYAAEPEDAPRLDRLRALDRGPPGGGGEGGDEPLQEGPPAAVGAGVVLRADGLIATAAHVVAEASRIVVKLADDRVLIATLVGQDEEADIALLRVQERWPHEPPLGDSLSLRPGDSVLAVGEPYGLGRSLVAGIVGGADRHFAEDPEVLFIQTDINLNPGNSGGPLLDAAGAIVGMNARSVVGPYGMAGVGLAMPIELVRQIADELEAVGGIARPRLGAHFSDLSPIEALDAGLARAHGAVVRSVRGGGWAERLGLRTGDIVVGVNGLPVSDGADLTRVLIEWREGTPQRLTVRRRGGYMLLRER